MKSYSEFKRGEDGFMKDLRGNVAEAHAELIGAAAMSTDPKVRGAHARWMALNELTAFLADSGKSR